MPKYVRGIRRPSGETIEIPVDELGGDVDIPVVSFAYLREDKPSGTGGGSVSTAAWNLRPLNTVVSDPDDIVSLASNQFTLEAGTYKVSAFAQALYSSHHRLRVRDTTNSVDLVVGTSHYAEGTADAARLFGVFTLADTAVCELQHYFLENIGANAMGSPASNAGIVEVYAEVEITKLA